MNRFAKSIGLAALAASCGFIAVWAATPSTQKSNLTEVAQSKSQWTGIAVSKEGRLFVNFPRWQNPMSMSVGELKDGMPQPFPDATWNSWKPGEPPENEFVCVQSVVVDGNNRCWILDPASPNMKGVVKGGPKLVQVDLSTNKVVRSYPFDDTVAPEKSYLNDVRFDLKNNIAFITESGTGAIIVVDLATGKARRLLSDHPSTKAENISIVIRGKKFMRNGVAPKIHADSIALGGGNLYYKALTGKTLYSVPIAALEDESLSADALASKVRNVGQTVPTDGMEFGKDGKLYVSSIEDDSVKRVNLSPGGKQPQLQTVAKDSRLDWPDSFAVASDGTMYVTASQIDQGTKPPRPYGLFKFKP